MTNLDDLQDRIGVTFRNPSLLYLALVHSSYINENPGIAASSNERLEFVGDAVLGMIVGEKVYQDFPQATEGELTRLRSALVRREALASISKSIDLGEYLLLGKGEEGGGGRKKTANLAGALEALFAAVYFDRGLETVRDFILTLFGPEIQKQAHEGTADYKSQLQEIIQAQRQVTPIYHLIEATGPDHDRLFTIEVKAGKTVLGKGTGKSKKSAEMEAARVALENFSGNQMI